MSTPDYDFMVAPRTRVHIYLLPPKLAEGYCFDGGHSVMFHVVDWFDATINAGRDELVKYIRGKKYYNPHARFLVIGDDPSFTFTIDPEPIK